MEVITNIALITINETMVIQLVSFLIFMFIMNRIMFRPLRKVMKERDDYITNLESEIGGAEKELEKINRQLREEEVSVRQDALNAKEELEKSGSQEAEGIFNVTRDEIEVLKTKAEKEIEAQIFEAKKYIRTESETLAVQIMEKILDRRLA